MPLDSRSFFVLHHVIDIYLETRLPVASSALSKRIHISSATIRNVMAELEEHDFLMSPHRSAGRLPTHHALRLYAQKIVYDQPLALEDQNILQGVIDSSDPPNRLSQALANLCKCASFFFSFPQDPLIHSIDFIYLCPGKAAAILVTQSGQVDRQIISIPLEVKACQLQEASNYLNARVAGYSLLKARQHIEHTLESQKIHLHDLSLHLINKELMIEEGLFHIKGHAHLLSTVQDVEELQAFKALFSWIETQKMFFHLLDHVIQNQHLQIFFGIETENICIEHCSLIIAPYQAVSCKGAIGVVGPLHMDYRRIIPIIDKAAKLVERTIVL